MNDNSISPDISAKQFIHQLDDEPGRAAFWRQVDIGSSAECWEWLGAKNADGYGICQLIEYYYQYAHRLAWQFANKRPIPLGQVVMHDCDNPCCVNPHHLRIGTTAENSSEFASRYGSGLTVEDKETVRRAYIEFCAVVAQEMGVSPVYVHRALRHMPLPTKLRTTTKRPDRKQASIDVSPWSKETRERIAQLLTAGWSQARIERELFGYDGGKAYLTVKSIIDSLQSSSVAAPNSA